MARPKKEINWDIVEKKMEAGCSAREISGGVCEINTFYDRFKERYGMGFADYADDYYSVGDGNIKFTQYMKAVSGNIPMLTLLGRERLNQGKEQEKVSPYEDILALRHENMILRAQIANQESNAHERQAE
jgi:hypothetical protein